VHLHKYQDISLTLIVLSHVTFVTSSVGAAVCKYLFKFTNENIVTTYTYFNAESRAVASSTEFQHISSLDLFVVSYTVKPA